MSLPVIDAHTHLAPMLPDDVPAPAVPAALHDPDALTSHLAVNALDAAIVSIPPPYFRQGQDETASAAWVSTVNDGLLRRVAEHAALRPLAYLPLDQPAVALAEWERRRTDPRWVGASASAGGRSASLADPALEPLWRRLADDGAAMLLHPGDSADPRLREYYLANLLGNPVETAVAAAQLVFGGVLTRLPDLRILLVHCGGAVPALAGRWQRGHDTNRPGLDPAAEAPSAALRRLATDTLSHDPRVVELAAAVFGPDQLTLGSDWPFPMGTPDPRAVLANLPATLRARIEHGAARVFDHRL
ncbi:amidohydrolase family protein [Jiangella endophytica]|uniref:amidohydrolase family protein n=1 Tax=Jiangella endophytica TaxID=1623398 RepID=UPI0018E591AC|nr:amidohydrolase family protein [Jiangella endophytica]